MAATPDKNHHFLTIKGCFYWLNEILNLHLRHLAI